jgi:deoxycytidylate deaminase
MTVKMAAMTATQTKACARAIVAAGIRRFVAPTQITQARDEKWQAHFHYAREIFELANVEVEFASPLEAESQVRIAARRK